MNLLLPDSIMETLRRFSLLSLWMKSYGVTIQMKLLQRTFTWYYLNLSILQNEIWDFF